jgi:hypothetical protein
MWGRLLPVRPSCDDCCPWKLLSAAALVLHFLLLVAARFGQSQCTCQSSTATISNSSLLACRSNNQQQQQQ